MRMTVTIRAGRRGLAINWDGFDPNFHTCPPFESGWYIQPSLTVKGCGTRYKAPIAGPFPTKKLAVEARKGMKP